MIKNTQTRYGIEITKPHSKEMYEHNDAIALEMKRNLISEIHKSYSQAMGNISANGGMDKGEKDLRKIVRAFVGYNFSDGYGIDEIRDTGINTLANVENYMLHQEYGYLCSESIVPKLRMKMLGFDKASDDCWDSYWEEDYKESRQELENDRDRLHNIYISQTRTIHELQDEIVRLKEIDNQTSDRVRAGYSINDEGQCIVKEDKNNNK